MAARGPPPTVPKPSSNEIVGRYTYSLQEKIGEGAYGVVYRALADVKGRGPIPVAVKKLRLDGHREGVPATAIREITILQELEHPNIVRLIDLISVQRRLFLVFEFMEHDLRKEIYSHTLQKAVGPPAEKPTPPPVSVETIKSYLHQMLLGLEHCHRHRIIHRDLKPCNVLVSGRGESALLKIADFGLARAFELTMQTYTHEVVTLWYRAPEILLGEPHYTTAVDLWSLGCIMAEMALRQPLFRGKSEIDQLMKIFHVLGTPTEESWTGVTELPHYQSSFPTFKIIDFAKTFPMLGEQGVDLLRKLLVYNPKLRITAQEALEHPWLA